MSSGSSSELPVLARRAVRFRPRFTVAGLIVLSALVYVLRLPSGSQQVAGPQLRESVNELEQEFGILVGIEELDDFQSRLGPPLSNPGPPSLHRTPVTSPTQSIRCAQRFASIHRSCSSSFSVESI